MNNSKLSLNIFLGLFLFCLQANAQISTREVPSGFKYDFGKENMFEIVMPDIDIVKLQEEDEKEFDLPPRFGFIHSVNINLLETGYWHTLENGDELCQLTIICPNALSINLLYDKFWLPEGAKFFIYSQNKEHYIGAFTYINNKGTKNTIESFATGLVYGNTIILEYYLPANCTEKAIISISGVVHGYRYILPEYGYGNVPGNNPNQNIGFGQSGNCQVNINCPEGNNWQNEKRAVALILVNGNRNCTGSLINNTNNDNYPYLLTADHCLGIYDAIDNPNLNHWTFYWNYELPTNSNNCNYNNSNPSEPLAFSTSGAQILANYSLSVSDFALLKLTEDPIYFSNHSPSYIPYYLGWDRTGSSGTGGIGIHHPRGDVKKISTHNQVPVSYTVGNGTNNYWMLYWMQTSNGHSITEGGSSGSALINNNRRVIGQLYGTDGGNCSNPANKNSIYGKFSVSWTGNGATDNRRKLQPWLDPLNTGSTTLDGLSLLGLFQGTLSGVNDVQLCNTYTYTYNYSEAKPSTCQLRWRVSSDLAILSGQGTSSINIQPVAKTSATATVYIDIIRSGSVVKTITKQINVLGSNTSYTNLSTEDFTISSNTTWSGNKALGVKATVAAGITLTITGTIYATENGEITVNPGGKLTVNGGTLTNSCPGEMWQGIIVYGDSTIPISSVNQTYIQLLTNSTIENAVCGLRVYNGGRIQTSGSSSFVNNKIGVKFEQIAPGQSGSSGSFYYTNFVLNNNYLGNSSDFEAHIIAQSCGNVYVKACTLSSTAPKDIYITNRNNGILAFNTNLFLEEYCTGSINYPSGLCEYGIIPNYFSGFTNAVWSTNSGAFPIFKAWYNNFARNIRGIYIDGINNHQLIRNQFTVPEDGPDGFTYGAGIINATGYRIEENIFHSLRGLNPPSGIDRMAIGLHINNSGMDENEVYNNSFNNFAIGQSFSGNNGSSGRPYTGLQTLCNTFISAQNTDILVGTYPGILPPPYTHTIRMYQGSTLTSAGNLFTGTPFFSNIENFQSPNTITYYYGTQPNELPPIVQNVFLPSNPVPSNGCPSKIGVGIKSNDELEDLLSQYDAWNDLYEYWLALLAITSEDDEEYENILQMVSYYSALKDNYFNGIIVSIMEEESRKQKAEGEKQSFDYAQLPKTEDDFYETLRFLFNYRNHYTDNLSIVETYLAESNFREALVALTNIYEQFELTEEQINELTGLQTYINWLQQLENEQKSIYQLSEREIEYLVSFVATHTGRGKVFANNILCVLYDICIEEAEGRRQKAESDDEMMRGLDDEMMNIPLQALEGCPKGGVVERGSFLENITIAPNPTTGELTISPAGGGKGVEQLTINSVEIFDIYGKCHLSLVTCHSTHVTLNISHLSAGLYFVKISNEAGMAVKKIIKQ